MHMYSRHIFEVFMERWNDRSLDESEGEEALQKYVSH